MADACSRLLELSCKIRAPALGSALLQNGGRKGFSGVLVWCDGAWRGVAGEEMK